MRDGCGRRKLHAAPRRALAEMPALQQVDQRPLWFAGLCVSLSLSLSLSIYIHIYIQSYTLHFVSYTVLCLVVLCCIRQCHLRLLPSKGYKSAALLSPMALKLRWLDHLCGTLGPASVMHALLGGVQKQGTTSSPTLIRTSPEFLLLAGGF